MEIVNCEYQAKVELLFAVAVLDNARKGYSKPETGVHNPLTELALPGADYFEIAVEYAALSKPARDYMEQAVGESPFSFVESARLLADY